MTSLLLQDGAVPAHGPCTHGDYAHPRAFGALGCSANGSIDTVRRTLTIRYACTLTLRRVSNLHSSTWLAVYLLSPPLSHCCPLPHATNPNEDIGYTQ